MAASFYDIAPEARQKLLTLTNVATPYPQLTIIDIFYQTNAPVSPMVTNASLSAASSVSGAVSGLKFACYETAASWSVLPTFAALTPVLQGAVNGLDLTPRRERSGYAFNYTGYLNVASNGLYAFTLNSCSGSALYVDGRLVVNNDGLHSPEDMSGWIGLQTGYHPLNVQCFSSQSGDYDTLRLAYEGPGLTNIVVPASAFFRVPGLGEPSISVSSPASGATIANANVQMSAAVTPNGNIINTVQFYVGNNYWAEAATAPYSLNFIFWASPTNALRARLFYNTTNLIDSAVNLVNTTNMTLAPWQFRQIFYHYLPSGARIQAGTYSIIGDGMDLLTRQATGDCTLIAHLAGLPNTSPAPDGTTASSGWETGIIMRGTTNMTPGYPWGESTTAPFSAVFGTVGGNTYYQDETMVNGGGGYSSVSLGGQTWFKLQRTGNLFTSSVSSDGVSWSVVKTNILTDFGPTLYAGFFSYAGPSYNWNIPWASFDSVNLTGTNVSGAASVIISPQTNGIISGLPAMFTASVVGPAPSGYQWQLNGTNLTGATNLNFSIVSVGPGNAGNYTVIANSVTSAPAALVIIMPAGSGVWTNQSGGSWIIAANWTNNAIAGGTDALADFSTQNLSANPAVTLDGARTAGTLVFDDLNPVTKHGWTLNTGTGDPLTLAASSGPPTIVVKNATNIINAVLAGTQGFNKTAAGYLTLAGASTIGGTINVNAGTLDMQNKSGDTSYTIAQGATLRIGYGTGGGYANTGLTISGNGAAATTGLFLIGGQSYNASGQIILQGSPTTIRQYGSGLAGIGTFDINGNGLWCQTSASGSAIDPNVQMVSRGYGMSVQVDAGVNTTTGDLTINGPLNVGSLGFYKRGSGSLVLHGTAASANTALNLQSGTVICGVANCIGTNASVPISSGTGLQLGGFNQAIVSLNVASGSRLSFGGTNTLTVASAPVLAGNLEMIINKSGTPACSEMAILTGTLTNGGTLTVTNIGASLAGGDTFKLFSASGYAGAFTNINIQPPLPVSLILKTNALMTNGVLAVVFNPLIPVITNLMTGSNRSSLALSGTGAGRSNYVLQAATNLPPKTWLSIQTNLADINGVFNFTNLQTTNYSQQFYRVLLQ